MMRSSGIYLALGALGMFATIVSFFYARYLQHARPRGKALEHPELVVRVDHELVHLAILPKAATKERLLAAAQEIQGCVVAALRKQPTQS